MILDVLAKINWVDILVVIILIRICYIAMKKGFVVELFKLLGVTLASYIAPHYYTVLSDLIREHLVAINERMPLEFLDFLSFLVLVILSCLIFVILRIAFHRTIKMEAISVLNKWGGLVLGLIRGVLLTGLVIYSLVISSTTYLKDSVSKSYSGKRIFKIMPDTYDWMWNSLASKFMLHEKFNKTILEVQEDFLEQ